MIGVDVDTFSKPMFPEGDNVNDIETEALPDERDKLIDQEGLKDYETVLDETLPGEDDPIGGLHLPRILAQRVTEVSDTIVFGAGEYAPDESSMLLIPQHRDRLRVTIQCDPQTGEPTPYIGRGPDVSPSNGWGLLSATPIVFKTRAAIWLATGPGTGTVTVQWAIELVEES